MKKIIAIAACLIVALFCLAGCGKDMSGSPYLGTWSATVAEYSGLEMSVESILGGEFTLTLEDDGGCTLSIAGEEDSGSWDETEKGFNVEDEFDFIVAEDGIATLDYDGIILSFEKQ